MISIVCESDGGTAVSMFVQVEDPAEFVGILNGYVASFSGPTPASKYEINIQPIQMQEIQL